MRKLMSYGIIGKIILPLITSLTLIGVFILSPVATHNITAASATVPINMIYYGWHNSTVDTGIINAHPEFLVDNSPAGPWKGNASISKMSSAGIKYFEYLDGGYEGTVLQAIPNDLQSNLNFINAASAAGAYGVFLDEVSSSPSSTALNYLKQIADRAHSLGLMVVFNTGVDSWSDSLMAYCDFVNSSEGWNNTNLTASQSKWASRTWLLTQSVTSAVSAANLTNAAMSKGIRAHYACTTYGALPTWLSTYVSQIYNPGSVSIAPAVSTGTASSITESSVTLNANLSNLGSSSSVSVSFDWGLTTSYGNTTPVSSVTTIGTSSTAITSLASSTTYHFRVKAVGSSTVYGNDATFTTSAPIIAPSITTGTASSITESSVTLNANLSNLGSSSSVSVSFDWGLTTSYGNTTPVSSVTTIGTSSTAITSLASSTTYHFRVKAVGSSTVYGNDATFTTSAPIIAPSITTGTASSITESSVTLNGNLSNLGSSSSVSVSFDWGLTTSYGNTTPVNAVTTIGTSSAAITSLASSTTYHFRVKAVGSSTVYGNDATFTTSAPIIAPSITTGIASSITESSSTLNANLSNLGSSSSVSVSFDWGLTTSYGNTTPVSSLTTIGTSSAAITSLASSTTYHFRVKAVGSSTVYGNDVTFTTSAPIIAPSITTGTASSITESSATLNANLSNLGSSSSVSVSFDWGLTTSYGNTTPVSSLTTIGTSSAAITSLAYSTTYHFRVKAVGSSTVYGNDAAFTTSAPIIAPSITTGTASNITESSATLNANLSNLGSSSSVSVSFDWGLTTSYGNTTQGITLTSIEASGATITSLESSTTYHFRVKAVGSSTVYGNDATFTTAASATVSGNTVGTVVGTPVPSGGANEYCFNLKITSTTVSGVVFGQQVWCAATQTSFPNLLTPGATLNGNLDKSLGWWVLNSAGNPSTPVVAPSIATGIASNLTVSGATLNGTLSNMGSASAVSVSFEWGLTTSYGNTTPVRTVTNTGTSSVAITSLASNTTYHFRLKAIGSSTVYGSDATFTTATSLTVLGNTVGTVVGTPVPSGGANEYCFNLKITSSTVSGVIVGQQVWCAATKTSFPNLLTRGATLKGNLDKSLGWWVLK